MSSSAGPSKNMSIEEEARQKNKSFWEVNPELDDAEAAELACAGDADFQLERDNVESTSADADATTTDGGDIHVVFGTDIRVVAPVGGGCIHIFGGVLHIVHF